MYRIDDVASAERAVENAVLRALAYADVFDWPLTQDEVIRYCPAPGGEAAGIAAAIESLEAAGAVERRGGYFCLPGRQSTVLSRRRQEALSDAGWRAARLWGRLIWMLPFVRMVAVTGSLAAGSLEEDGDIDFMIVTEPGRLWLTRALCLVVWRVAALRGTRLCPNYFVTADTLTIDRPSLYTAHELVRMRPLHGREVAFRLWTVNAWTPRFLPNARLDCDRVRDPRSPIELGLKRLGEAVLGGKLGNRLEAWERGRKIAKLGAQVEGTEESRFSPDVCKYHAGEHGRRALARYATRLAALGQVEDEESSPGHERAARSH